MGRMIAIERWFIFNNFVESNQSSKKFYRMKSELLLSCCLLTALIPAFGQQKSPKRGICWDEKTQKLTDAPVNKMMPGVSWIYTWGEAVNGSATNVGTEEGMGFAPMAWGKGFNENALRNYIREHKNVKYLLGFNEPNFAAQSNMTPAEAVEFWPTLEAIATEYNLKLAAPALNFTGEQVGGRVWGIYDWLDEFIKVYKEKHGKLPKMDLLALHCYMNWYGANTWFVNEYIYSDIFKNGNDTKYPNIVEMLNTAKETTGSYPRMMLTEFCSWEGDKDGFKTTVDNQIDQMTQRCQKMEQSELVEGYAWFMANPDNSGYPYMNVFESNKADSELSALGKVYVNMSGYDREKFYTPGERVEAQDYVDATTDDQIVRVRPNTEEGSELPLQIELTKANLDKSNYSAATYQIEAPKADFYTFTLHAKAGEGKVVINVGGVDTELTLSGDAEAWADYTVEVALPEGKSEVRIQNMTENPVLLNSWKFDGKTCVDSPEIAATVYTVYNLQGICMGTCSDFNAMEVGEGAYILVAPDGTSRKVMK